MEVAYLILAHQKPRQLARLIKALPDTSPIFVHFDKRPGKLIYREARLAAASTGRDVTFVPQHVCHWGHPGIMHGTLELISAAVRSGRTFQCATLLSGSDYPIKDHDTITKKVQIGKEYIEFFSMLDDNPWSDQTGNFHPHARVFGRYFWFRSRTRRFGTRRDLPYGLKPFGGSQWWTLSNEALCYIDEFVSVHPALINFMNRSLNVDEFFIQTILGSSEVFSHRVCQNNLRLIVWDRPEPPYPAVLTKDDLPMISTSSCHFARKFDFEAEPDLADKIDELRAAISEKPAFSSS